MDKQYFKDLERMKTINEDIVEKERLKNHHKTPPQKRIQLDKELKKLYEDREKLGKRINSYHDAQANKKRH
jgi:predicted ribosome quality control (RQC) complex YloA/Tae2 family protein